MKEEPLFGLFFHVLIIHVQIVAIVINETTLCVRTLFTIKSGIFPTGKREFYEQEIWVESVR